MLPAGDTAGLSVLDTPYNSGREHSALSCSQMMTQWSETEWFDQAMQLGEAVPSLKLAMWLHRLFLPTQPA